MPNVNDFQSFGREILQNTCGAWASYHQAVQANDDVPGEKSATECMDAMKDGDLVNAFKHARDAVFQNTAFSDMFTNVTALAGMLQGAETYIRSS